MTATASADPQLDSWFPSMVVSLTIRYDEAVQLDKSADTRTAAQVAATSQEGRVTGQVTTNTAGGARKQTTKKTRPRRAIDEAVADVNGVQQLLNGPLGAFSGPVTQQAAIARINRDLAALDRINRGQSPNSVAGATPTSPGVYKSNTVPAAGVPLTFGTDGFTVIANRVPSKASVTLPHPRSAATFSLEFDYHEFPVDPRIIRAVGVEIHLGAVSADDYARGMGGAVDSTGRPLSILKTTLNVVDQFSGRPASDPSTLLFYGICDTWKVVHNSDNASVIALDGRDIRSLFIDRKIDTAVNNATTIGKPSTHVTKAGSVSAATNAALAKVDLRQPIDEVVTQIIETIDFEYDLRMAVVADAAEWPDGKIPSPADAGGVTRVRLGSSGDASSGTPSSGDSSTYWDLITNYCTLVGAIPQWNGNVLWIRPSENVFDVLDNKSRVATPFAGGKPRQVGKDKWSVPRLVLGRSLSKLEFDRKFAGAVVPAIVCYSFDDTQSGSQRLISAQWPPGSSPQAGAKASADVHRVPVWGIKSLKQLESIARGIYEEIGRGETGGSAETADLATLGGDNADPDVLRIRSMTPVEFLVDAGALTTLAPVVSEVIESSRRTFSEEVEAVASMVGDHALARALVSLARGAVQELLTVYQVTQIVYNWSQNGVKIGLSFQNYITPRQQAVSPADKSSGKTDTRAATIIKVGQAFKNIGPALTAAANTADALGVDPPDTTLAQSIRNKAKRYRPKLTKAELSDLPPDIASTLEE